MVDKNIANLNQQFMQILACCPVSSGYTMHWLCEQDKHTHTHANTTHAHTHLPEGQC